MISNDNDLSYYSNFNKIYVPSNYNNQNWVYKLNGDYITIITNRNCYTQYSTTYCDCYLYNFKNNLISDSYVCSNSNNNYTIPYEVISSDINYSSYLRNVFLQDKLIFGVMFIIAFLFALFLTKERSY